MLQEETMSRKAFDLYNRAKHQVARYERTLNNAELEQALSSLDAAIAADGDFFKPAHFKGIVYDLKGWHDEAITQFDSIIGKSPVSLRDEVAYNKAVAKYHRYLENFIAEAIAILEPLDKRLDEQSWLSPLVKAVLAQSYAMMVHHSMKKQDDQFIQVYKERADNKAEEALKRVDGLKKQVSDTFLNQARWVANNAKGVSLMYFDDNVRDQITEDNYEDYSKKLKKAIGYFDKASKYSPNNWALECNQASARMRLGHLLLKLGRVNEANAYFDEAESRLKNVITTLRPDYDFAIYETGRIKRFRGDGPSAVVLLQTVIDMGEGNSSISLKRLHGELNAAKNGITSFNL
jgi:hypothetical protein